MYSLFPGGPTFGSALYSHASIGRFASGIQPSSGSPFHTTHKGKRIFEIVVDGDNVVPEELFTRQPHSCISYIYFVMSVRNIVMHILFNSLMNNIIINDGKILKLMS